MMIRRGDRKYREFECSECEIKRHIYEIERENLYYSIKKSKERKFHEKTLNNKLKTLEDQFAGQLDPNLLMQIEECKQELENYYQIKTEGHIIRSRANWVENGERNTNYFINLEKINQKLKNITALYTDEGCIVNSTRDILNTEKLYFENVYASDNPPLVELNNIIQAGSESPMPKLSDNSKQICEVPITLQ